MKSLQFSLRLLTAIGSIFILNTPVYSQTGNQSDATGPNLSDVFPNPPETIPLPTNSSENIPQSSETSEIIPQPSSENLNIMSGDYEIDRAAVEQTYATAAPDFAMQTFEEVQAVEFSQYLGLELYGKTPTIDQIAKALYELYQVTGKKSVLMYVFSLENELQTLTIFPKNPKSAAHPSEQPFIWVNQSLQTLLATQKAEIGGLLSPTACLLPSAARCLPSQFKIAQQDQEDPSVRILVPTANRKALEKVLKEFRGEITNPAKLYTTSYLKSAQQLYQWIIAPIESQLEANKVDIITFAMDAGLRSTPIAAFHDGKQFLVEKYGLALVPSFGLTDSRYADVRNASILGMGASRFADQIPLPAVPVELSTIVGKAWRGGGDTRLNEQFTVQNFKELNRQQRFRIIHLATHGEFQEGSPLNSYIQFSDAKLNLLELRQIAADLGWGTANAVPVELMVLSACRTALGNKEAELGFAGLAVAAGVKSAIASLWYVSDVGTLALMTNFYNEFKITPNKSEALRNAQLAMLRGEMRVENGQLRSPNLAVELPANVNFSNTNLSHPFYWSAFTLIGNWN